MVWIIIILSKWLNSSSWSINGNLIGTTIPVNSAPGSNGNEGVLHIPQISRTGASPSDAVKYCTQDTRWGNILPPQPTGPKQILLAISGAKAKYVIGRIGLRKQNLEQFLKGFFSLIRPIFEKKNVINLKFHYYFRAFFNIKIQPNLSE